MISAGPRYVVNAISSDDIMKKREAKIYEIRKEQKTAKLTKLRKMRHIMQDNIQLEMIYLNVRGLNNKIK